MYHHIIYMYDFFDKFRRLFCYDLHRFSRDCGLHRCFFEKPRRVRLFLALQQNFWVTGWRQSIISPASTRQEKKKGANFCTSSSLLHFNFAKAKFTASHDQRLRYCCQCTFYGNIEKGSSLSDNRCIRNKYPTNAAHAFMSIIIAVTSAPRTSSAPWLPRIG